jgi:unsaturated rhamnogalacturonyl hydrolase
MLDCRSIRRKLDELMTKPLPTLVLRAAAFFTGTAAFAQNPHQPNEAERQAAGDQPDDPGPLATDLSPKLERTEIVKVMKAVADWQLKEAESRYNIDWTFAALYDGMLAASRVTGDRRYHDRILEIAAQNHWSLGPRFAPPVTKLLV